VAPLCPGHLQRQSPADDERAGWGEAGEDGVVQFAGDDVAAEAIIAAEAELDDHRAIVAYGALGVAFVGLIRSEHRQLDAGDAVLAPVAPQRFLCQPRLVAAAGLRELGADERRVCVHAEHDLLPVGGSREGAVAERLRRCVAPRVEVLIRGAGVAFGAGLAGI
jgi:hypothetical protein